MEDTAFIASFMPRIAATVCVVLLIGSIATAGIGTVAVVGPALAHGNNTEHALGLVVAIGPGKDFVLKTFSGKSMAFRCAPQCRASLAHLQRHLRERADTDVYYIQRPGNILVALDAD